MSRRIAVLSLLVSLAPVGACAHRPGARLGVAEPPPAAAPDIEPPQPADTGEARDARAPAGDRLLARQEATGRLRAIMRESRRLRLAAGLWLASPELLDDPAVHVVLQPETLHFEPSWNDEAERVTFYVERYAIDFPRELLRPATHFRIHGLALGGLGVSVAGNCKFRFWVQRDLFAPLLAEFADELCRDVDDAGRGSSEPGFPSVDQCTAEVRRHLAFESDYELLCALYTHDFRDLSLTRLAQMSTAELLAATVLAMVKPSTMADGGRRGIWQVRTPHFRGFAYGRFETHPQSTIQLHDQGRCLMLNPAADAGGDADPAALLDCLGSIIGSVRQHGSSTPGRDMLDAARRILADNRYAQDETIARTLILCSTRYDDAFAEAVELGQQLVDPDWSQRLKRIYIDILHRRYPW